MQSNTEKRVIKTGDEEDVYTGWRRWYCWTQRAGTCKGVKRKTHKRERQDGKRRIREELE